MMNIAFNPASQRKQQVGFGSTVDITELAKYFKTKDIKKIVDAVKPLLTDEKDAHLLFSHPDSLYLYYDKQTRQVSYSGISVLCSKLMEVKSTIRNAIKEMKKIDAEKALLELIPENLKTERQRGFG